jgi:hypothetical protein
MKRVSVPLMFMFLLLTACGGNESSISPDKTVSSPLPANPAITIDIDAYADNIRYSPDIYSNTHFTVDENGILYLDESNYNVSTATVVRSYDLNGKKLEDHRLSTGGSIFALCANDGILYIASYAIDMERKESGAGIYSYDISSRETTLLTFLSDVNYNIPDYGIKKIMYLDDTIYILMVDPNYADTDVYDIWSGNAYESTYYSYDGTVLMSYDLTEGTLSTVFSGVDLHNFTVTPEGVIILFAHDSEGGYYFMEFNPADMTAGEKFYRYASRPKGFAFGGSGVLFVSDQKLKYSFLTHEGSVSLVNDINPYHADAISYSQGFAFYNSGNSIERIKLETLIRDIPILNFISVVDPDAIIEERYLLNTNIVSEDAFALTVLANDAGVDLSYLRSYDNFSENIRDKGSFYPLNDVPGVQEFIDACLPFVRDAVTDGNGDIWALPLEVYMRVLIYHEENCNAAGIDFSSAKTTKEISACYDAVRASDVKSNRYFPDVYSFLQDSIRQYLRGKDTLDTAEFRDLAETIKHESDLYPKGTVSVGDPMFFQDIWDLKTYVAEGTPDFLFTSGYASLEPLKYSDQKNLRVIATTGTAKAPSSFCTFLVVNPNSKNLEATLGYITASCEQLMTQQDAFMLSDPAMYTDIEYIRQLYALYESAVIDFNISDEVFAEDFNRYLNGEITLDEMIAEADRKLAMYWNE